VIPKEAQQAMQRWLSQATPLEQQLDRRWVGRYRDLTSQDSFWWHSWAGPFTEQEQQQWDRLFKPPVDEATKEQLAPLVSQSRERELEAALAQQREPHLHYPAIEIDDVRRRISGLVELDAEIEREEPNVIVRRLYRETIEKDVDYLRVIEATYNGDTDRYWAFNRRTFYIPTSDEVAYAFAWVRRLIQQGFEQPETAEISQQLLGFIQERLHLSLDLSVGKGDPPVALERDPSATPRTISAKAVKDFYETILREGGYEGWQVSIDAAGGGTRVEAGLRQLILSEESWTLEIVKSILAHELAGHVARSFAGEHSPLGLLGIGTRNYSPTEEGLALYHEQVVATLHGHPFDDSGLISGTLAMGLASGVVTPPQTFSSLYTFIERLIFLYRRLLRPWRERESDQKRAHTYALRRCLRTFRGVPDLGQAGVCNLQDTMYLRGILLIDRLVAEDKTVLDRLMVGKVAYDLLPMLQPLDMVPSPQPLRELLADPELDNYILSFEAPEEKVANPA
jgi:Domain of unknown function (DUF1704)